MKTPFWISCAVMLMCVAAEAQSKRLAVDVVDKDFRVTVTHSGSGAFGSFSVVGNLATDVVRVPLFKGTEAVLVVKVGAHAYSLNSDSYVRPQAQFEVVDPTRMVEGKNGAAPLVILSCERAIDWKAPGELVLLDGENTKLTVTIEAVEGESAAASGDAGE